MVQPGRVDDFREAVGRDLPKRGLPLKKAPRVFFLGRKPPTTHPKTSCFNNPLHLRYLQCQSMTSDPSTWHLPVSSAQRILAGGTRSPRNNSKCCKAAVHPTCFCGTRAVRWLLSRPSTFLPETVEEEAINRLGRKLSDSGVAIEQCVAVRVPDSLKTVPQHRS